MAALRTVRPADDSALNRVTVQWQLPELRDRPMRALLTLRPANGSAL